MLLVCQCAINLVKCATSELEYFLRLVVFSGFVNGHQDETFEVYPILETFLQILGTLSSSNLALCGSSEVMASSLLSGLYAFGAGLVSVWMTFACQLIHHLQNALCPLFFSWE